MANSELAHGPTLLPSHPNTGASRSAGDRLEPGASCGEYVVDHFLGAGAMGEVYAGHHPLINKKVAIKILKSSSAEASERFVREARAVNQVDHPNVVDVFAFGTLPDGRLYLVMDLVAGRSLRQAVQEGPLDVPVALDVLAQIADALDAAHSRGVVHRDLKPDNVMLSGDPPKVFVLDFGIAKLVTNNATLNGNGTLTGEGSWLGTPGYMAPEQWSAEGAGPASDRYALGVMAFELLSGKLPFQAPTLPQMMEQHFRAPVPALATRRGTVKKTGAHEPPPTLDPVLARAMAKDPTKRFATGKELVAALREAAAGKRFGNRRLWVPAAAGASVLGLAVVAVIATRDKGRPAPVAAPAATETPTPPPVTGQVAFEIFSTPPGAVVRHGAVLGQTPYKLMVTPGEQLALKVQRLGYAPVAVDVVAPAEAKTHAVELTPIVGFRGIWRLEKSGALRRFERVDDHVTGYKLESIDDAGRLYRRFELVEPSSRQLAGDLAWLTTETTTEGTHPSCQVASEVVFAYTSAPESLIVQVGLVKLRKQHDGTCVQVSRSSEIERLARVSDGGDEVVIRAPVGKPVKEPPTIKRPKQPDPKTLLDEKRASNNVDPKAGFDEKTKRTGNAKPDVGTDEAKSQDAVPGKPVTPAIQKKAPPSKSAARPPANQPVPQQPSGQANQAPPPPDDSQIAPKQKK